MIKLYQAEWCPWCHRVRELLTELQLTYVSIPVPVNRAERAEVLNVSGQDGVPVLVDGDTVIVDSEQILAYLRATYPAPTEAVVKHQAVTSFRLVRVLTTTVEETVDDLIERLGDQEIDVLTRYDGGDISVHLPDEYVLLVATMRIAAAKAVDIDATLPQAVTFPIAVFKTVEGTVVAAAKPQATVWLSEVPELLTLASAVTERLTKAIVAL